MKWKKAFEEIRLYKGFKGNSAPVFSDVIKILLSDIVPEFLKNAGRTVLNNNTPAYLNGDFVRGHKQEVHAEKKFPSILNNDLYNAFKISPLPSLLHIDDRSSMAHSVESRCPFLDYRLVEYAFSVPPEYKIREGRTKFLLREAMRECIPESVRTRQDKMGFPTPLRSWLKEGPLHKIATDIFNSETFRRRPYFDHEKIKSEFASLCKHDKPNELTVWSWINLELWFRRFIDAK